MRNTQENPDQQYSGAKMANRTRPRTRGFTIFLVVTLIVVLYMFFTFKQAVVDGPSMEPTFKTGRKLLVSKAYWLIGKIRKHDILVVHDNNKTGYMIKRVYAMEGEEVPWMYAPEGHVLASGPYVVPKGQIYLMGDNRGYSEDCRKIGAVPLEKVIGKVIVWN